MASRKKFLCPENEIRSQKGRHKFLCLDCGVDTGKIGEFYYINLPLWISAVGSKEGMLCIGCLETRIGRQLTKEDFTDCWINNPSLVSKSQRLLERLTSKAGKGCRNESG
jgi:hypothetical protein